MPTLKMNKSDTITAATIVALALDMALTLSGVGTVAQEGTPLWANILNTGGKPAFAVTFTIAATLLTAAARKWPVVGLGTLAVETWAITQWLALM